MSLHTHYFAIFVCLGALQTQSKLDEVKQQHENAEKLLVDAKNVCFFLFCVVLICMLLLFCSLSEKFSISLFDAEQDAENAQQQAKRELAEAKQQASALQSDVNTLKHVCISAVFLCFVALPILLAILKFVVQLFRLALCLTGLNVISGTGDSAD